MLIIADMLYTQTGDLSAVSDHYDAMKKWLAYMKGRYMTAGISSAGTSTATGARLPLRPRPGKD